MTIEELKKRRQLCMENDLCFISLQQFRVGDPAMLIMHEGLGERVLVRPEYVKGAEKWVGQELEVKDGDAA